MPTTLSTARLEARISTSLHSMLKRAAELQGRTMTDFRDCRRTGCCATRHRASGSRPPVAGGSGVLCTGASSPPQPSPALKRAFSLVVASCCALNEQRAVPARAAQCCA